MQQTIGSVYLIKALRGWLAFRFGVWGVDAFDRATYSLGPAKVIV